MAKRKREDSPEEVFQRVRHELFKALKLVKGFERQRQAKRLTDKKSTPDKIERIQKEVVVLKSLDLHQAANAHLCNSLLRIKSIAESPRLPKEVKEVEKPNLTEDEKKVFNNVTSALYNHQKVRETVDDAITALCAALGVPVPEKKRGKKPTTTTTNPDPTENGQRAVSVEKEEKPKKEKSKTDEKSCKKAAQADDSSDDEDDFEGFDGDEDDEEAHEKAVSKMEELLGSDSESSAESDHEEPEFTKAQLTKPNPKLLPGGLDPMEITDDEDDNEPSDWEGIGSEITATDSDSNNNQSDSERELQKGSAKRVLAVNDDDISDDDSDSPSEPGQPPSKRTKTSTAPKEKKPTEKKKASSGTGNKSASRDSTFLPTLMGGYISGSESEASDIEDVAPRKNRRGQRARRAIWEAKYKDDANHIKNAPAGQQPSGKGGRDAGWDARKGAVGPDDRRQPWKRGVRDPLQSGANTMPLPGERKKAPPKKDDSGPLHPSWEAKKKAKAAQSASAPFQGKKITFD
ncbi:Bud-site selection protein [Diplogelasinospora grovesii]|uniref:Bud-site selection protein n=1 Tax=Diplogelasinospora grovesii TaxID=303347 RepID=A0AAN6NHL0_9PEZI|nr:Bud-site selection protein [Diplogelasinospora grovesii]